MQTVEEFHAHLDEAVAYIKSQISLVPKIGIILGTGLGSLVDGIEMVGTVSYDKIPHFPVSTVESHAGRLLFGTSSRQASRLHAGAVPLLRRLQLSSRSLSRCGCSRSSGSDADRLQRRRRHEPEFQAGRHHAD